MAIIAVDNATGEVRAHVGGVGYFDKARAGQIDLAQSLRSPGSTLKPFIYGLAFEDGFVHPESLIELYLRLLLRNRLGLITALV